MNKLLHMFFIFGYSGLCLNVNFRRVFAKTKIHKSWLAGHMGVFTESDKLTSVTDRDWTINRKTQGNSKFTEFKEVFLNYYNITKHI